MTKAKRRILGISGLLLILGLCAFGFFHFSMQFYFLFGNSDSIFTFRHNRLLHFTFYTDHWSYEQGDDIGIFASSRLGDIAQASLYELAGEDTIWANEAIPVKKQTILPDASLKGCNWERSALLPLPPFCNTGWYVLTLKKGSEIRHTSIFIKPKAGEVKKKVAILLSTNSWNAYNPWGGQSLYTKNYTPEVSFNRPQLLADPFIKNSYPNYQFWFQGANKDKYLADLLADAGIAFDAYSMTDLDKGSEFLLPYDVAIISTHSEYWTRPMIEHLNTFLDSAGSLLSLSGNTANYVSEIDHTDRSLIVHKSYETLWKVTDSTGFRPFGTETFFDGFHTYAPYETLADTSWVFEGSGLKKGDLFGEKSDTYDYTQMYGSWISNLFGFQNRGKMGAASGMEIDRTYAGTPENWVSLATGLNPAKQGRGEVYPDDLKWNGEGGAHMGYYMHPGGGIVFNVSSLAFTGAIPYDTAIRRIVLNVVEQTSKIGNRKP